MRSPDDSIESAAGFIAARWPRRPRAGIILGTGLGELAAQVDVETTIDYEAIPHFLRSTAVSHRGQLQCGLLAGRAVIVMQGRHHAYEGYSLAETTLPVRVMQTLGAELLFLSNSAGGMNPAYAAGDVMLIDDHIDLQKRGRGSFLPLLGEAGPVNYSRPRLLRSPYDAGLIRAALEVARRDGFVAHHGVYVAVTGPNLETRAEYRMFRRIGGDAVGMSTVPEAIVAAQFGLRVMAVSTITNVCLPDALRPVDIEQIVATAQRAAPKVQRLIAGVLQQTAATENAQPI